jgi:hypothetical protein
LSAHFLRTAAESEQDLRNFSASAVSSRVLHPREGMMRLTGAMYKTPSSHRSSPLRLLRGAVVIAALSFVSSPLFAQNTNAADDARRKRGDGNGGDRGNFNPQDLQARMLAGLRERFEVADDEEWKLISERLTKVMELRRNTAGATFGAFGGRGPQGGSGGNDSGRSRGSTSGRPGGNTELTALASAVKDKLPDAEIKARLDRVRELRKENEVKLAKAQEELRAVLSVRQEALAVVAGLLP